jgi:hypothetical protein
VLVKRSSAPLMNQGVAKVVQGAANESGTEGGSKDVPSDIVPISNSSYIQNCGYMGE